MSNLTGYCERVQASDNQIIAKRVTDAGFCAWATSRYRFGLDASIEHPRTRALVEALPRISLLAAI